MKDVIEVNYGRKVNEKWNITHILGIFGGPIPVHLGPVPVQFGFWSFLANLYWYRLDLYRYTYSILTSVCILAITCSFLIRFE